MSIENTLKAYTTSAIALMQYHCFINKHIASSDCSPAVAVFPPRGCREGHELTECPIRNIKMKQKQEGACVVPYCKGIPSFGPILMPNDLTFNEAYLCVAHKELLVREVIERVIAKNVPFEILNN
jgi:hypothetical protein